MAVSDVRNDPKLRPYLKSRKTQNYYEKVADTK